MACDDSDPCTVADACGAGGCVGEPLDCSDDDPCTINEECVAGVCTASAEQDGTSCVGSNGCDFDGTCLQGVCEPSTTLCDDFNPCTVDGCQDNTCIYEPATDLLACEDGLSCTETGQCYAGQCIADDVNCDDDDPCTDDSCSEAEGGCCLLYTSDAADES